MRPLKIAGLAIIGAGIGILALGLSIFANYLHVQELVRKGEYCDDTPERAAAACAGPESGMDRMIGGGFVILIGGAILAFSRYARPVITK